ncbi:MAG: ATP-binding protein, partial [Acidobacteria bacterium]|nr:ATP-binding protein [Acidobacteriota bacterium]
VEKGTVGLTIASNFGFVELAEMIANNLARMVGFDEDTTLWIGMAVREGVINAIKHGNKGDDEKQVDIQFSVNSDKITVRIADQGEGFDPAQVPNPLDPENLLKPNGRGIFYMRTFMDEVEYTARPAGGTVVRMMRRKTQW